MILAGRKRGIPSSTCSLLISHLSLFLADGHVTPTAVKSFENNQVKTRHHNPL